MDKRSEKTKLKLTEVSNAKKVDCQNIGLVIYGDNSLYSEIPIENESIHIPLTKEKVVSFITSFFQEEKKVPLSRILIGHEHGAENKKCHFQCAVRFGTRFNKKIGTFDSCIDNVKIIGMFQQANNPAALFQYCQKGKDFIDTVPDKEFMNAYQKLASTSSLSTEEVTSMLAKECPRDLMLYGDKIQKNYQTFINILPPVEFKWTFPQHLIDEISQPTFLSVDEIPKINEMYQWFQNQCVNPQSERRQALFLLSKKRGLGKTEFAKRLVPSEDYYIYCRNSLDANEFMRKSLTAKLIILDDVAYIGKEVEMWKAIVAGQPVTLNTKYSIYPWKGGVPCIVLTNTLSTASFWLRSEDFKTQCKFINLNEFIGPNGTRPSFLEHIDCHFDAKMLAELEDYEKSRQEKRIFY